MLVAEYMQGHKARLTELTNGEVGSVRRVVLRPQSITVQSQALATKRAEESSKNVVFEDMTRHICNHSTLRMLWLVIPLGYRCRASTTIYF